MSASTKIQWTDKTWNPVTGCTKVSPGCAHCYAEGVAERFWAKQYPFVRVPDLYDSANLKIRPRRFTDVMTHEDRLLEPLSWRKPARVFVNSMSDLFHEDVPDAFIDNVFATIAMASRHTYQILTKRPERMRDYMLHQASIRIMQWPLPNVWLGVSVENQHFADERIPLLIKTPAAVRFVSCEPLLEKVLLDNGCNSWLTCRSKLTPDQYEAMTAAQQMDNSDCCESWSACGEHFRGIDWVIVGGESGPGARPFDLAWARAIVEQCKAAGVPVFVKQLGANVRTEDGDDCRGDDVTLRPVVRLKDRKGGEMAEWPSDLHVREYPV